MVTLVMSLTLSRDHYCAYTETKLYIGYFTELKWNLLSFYRAMLRTARYCHGKLSVRLSVTLRYRGHISLNSSQIISRLISLTFSLSANPNITAEGNTPNFSRKNWLYRRTKPAISPKRLKIERKSLLTTYIKSYNTGFRLPSKCITLNDLWARSLII